MKTLSKMKIQVSLFTEIWNQIPAKQRPIPKMSKLHLGILSLKISQEMKKSLHLSQVELSFQKVWTSTITYWTNKLNDDIRVKKNFPSALCLLPERHFEMIHLKNKRLQLKLYLRRNLEYNNLQVELKMGLEAKNQSHKKGAICPTTTTIESLAT